MHSFSDLSAQFNQQFSAKQFPDTPANLYQATDYFLQIGGKRIRPVLCLLGNELFEPIKADAWSAATAIELFHNFTLIHDDIMDKAPLRRGMQTVHTRYGDNTALLAGDVMMIQAYHWLNKVNANYLPSLLQLFNRTATEVCEGQQLDMDFESRQEVQLDEYLHMIKLKTSVLLACALQMGALIGGAGQRNQELIYSFGLQLGLAFQVQDDYLDAFGDPQKFGKQTGGDILANKKTFLLIHALASVSPTEKQELQTLLASTAADKVERVLKIYKNSGVDQWALSLKQQLLDKALDNLEQIAVLSARKEPLRELAAYLIQREV
ncbi:MAG: polyprenyl synthetase family protein [Sphingomonadales bacterium]|nr:polyprenyl synthetase family protein [Sphingomonadales bacterium]